MVIYSNSTNIMIMLQIDPISTIELREISLKLQWQSFRNKNFLLIISLKCVFYVLRALFYFFYFFWDKYKQCTDSLYFCLAMSSGWVSFYPIRTSFLSRNSYGDCNFKQKQNTKYGVYQKEQKKMLCPIWCFNIGFHSIHVCCQQTFTFYEVIDLKKVL